MKPRFVEILYSLRVAGLAVMALVVSARAAHPQAAALYATRCATCHTFGKGDRIGPDLKGVTDRRDRRWIMDWIRSSTRMIQAADPTARALYKKYGQQRMPDFDFSPEQLAAVVDYLAAGGPLADPEDRVRDAATATAAELRLGGQLFEGRVALASGRTACISCHTLASRGALGGTLGPDLTSAWAKYRDRGLDQYLQRTCLSRRTGGGGRHTLTPSESLALRAFLRASDPSTRALAMHGGGSSRGAQ
jgi:mono/diheme cytochrome c family protein